MSRDYYYLNNYSNYGIVGISRKSFTRIAELATNHVAGATVRRKGKKAISLFQMANPVQVAFRKDGKVDISVDVTIKKGVSVTEVCADIQNSVADSILMMCETVPFTVQVKVSAIG